MNQCTQCVGWRRRDRGESPLKCLLVLFVIEKYEKRKASLYFFLTAEKAKLFSTNRIYTGVAFTAIPP